MRCNINLLNKNKKKFYYYLNKERIRFLYIIKIKTIIIINFEKYGILNKKFDFISNHCQYITKE